MMNHAITAWFFIMSYLFVGIVVKKVVLLHRNFVLANAKDTFISYIGNLLSGFLYLFSNISSCAMDMP